MDIKRGGSLDSNLNFNDQVVRVVKGWVEHEFVLFIICRIATWHKVAKSVNILQNTGVFVTGKHLMTVNLAQGDTNIALVVIHSYSMGIR